MGALIYFGINAFIILMWFILENHLIFMKIKNQKGVTHYSYTSYEGFLLGMNIEKDNKFEYTAKFKDEYFSCLELIVSFVIGSLFLMPLTIALGIVIFIIVKVKNVFKKVISKHLESVEKSVDESADNNKEHLEYSERLMDLTKK